MQATVISCQQLPGVAGATGSSKQAARAPRRAHVCATAAAGRRARPFTSRMRPQRISAPPVQAALTEAVPEAAAQIVNKLKGTVYLAG